MSYVQGEGPLSGLVTVRDDACGRRYVSVPLDDALPLRSPSAGLAFPTVSHLQPQGRYKSKPSKQPISRLYKMPVGGLKEVCD